MQFRNSETVTALLPVQVVLCLRTTEGLHYNNKNILALLRLNSGNSTTWTRTTLFPSRWTLFR